MNISEETILIDSELAAPISISDINVGDTVTTEYSDIMTRSIPAQTSAYLIAVNVDKGGIVNRITADSIEKDENGNVFVTDNTKGIIVNVSKDASVKPFATKNIVTLEDITVGSQLLMWYDVVGLSMPAQASTEKVVIVNNAIVEEEENKEDSEVKADGTVSEIGEDYVIISIDNGKRQLQLNVSEETVIIDSELAVAVALSDIKEGDIITAEYSNNMTKSIPPQTNASLITVNAEKGGVVNRINADVVEKDKDGNIIVMDNVKDVVVTISKDAHVAPYATKNIVKVDDIQVGSDLLVWYNYATLSLPAQATTHKVVVVKTIPDFKLTVNGSDVELLDLPYYNGPTLMVPLRKIGEALGYTVGWNAEENAVTLEQGSKKATLLPDSKKVLFTGSEERETENNAETVISNETTFVPISFFSEFENTTNVLRGHIKIDAPKAEIAE